MQDGRWGLVLVCACYLGIVYTTSRGLIAAPRYRLLQARVRDCRARISALAAVHADHSVGTAALSALTGQLDDLERRGTVVWRLLPGSWVVAIPLSKLAAAWRVLHSVERRLLHLETPEEIAARLQSLRIRLIASSRPGDADLAAELIAELTDQPPAAGPEAQALLLAATEQLHDREDTDSERDYEHQRIALWLATTGLGITLLFGVVLGHWQTMLLGALGGFLSPLIGVMRAQRPSSWGALVLAPVGGALAAVGGLLLVRMLADPKLSLLGQVFLDNSWAAPARPIALAIALLFGFSGSLFSRLALTATGQLAPTRGQAAPTGSGEQHV